jgi:hypothetical protein
MTPRNSSFIGFGRGIGSVAMATFVGLIASIGCQQKMADQPAHRPYEESAMFANGQSIRPIVSGTFHRNQPLTDDPLVTWLTPAGKEPKHTANYSAWLDEQAKPKKTADGKDAPAKLSAADKEGLLNQKPQPGAPNDTANFLAELPFEMTRADYQRGQKLYTAICAECHGGAGHANGKIPERGFLRPPSYHTDPEGKLKDWSKYIPKSDGSTGPDYTGNPQGTSRGFYKYGMEVPLKEVPIGYIYQVIYWGYGGMGSHETQIPKPEDRWRVAAYVRALQMSQAADPAKLTPELRKKIEEAGKPNQDAKKAGDH